MPEKSIVHVDMDAFFAAIEQRDNPALKGKPVIVGADPKDGRGRGVVSTCSYEARKFGVKSAMPISEAWRHCPTGVFLHPDFKKYEAASEAIRSVFYEFTPDIEQVSIDEAFLDITHSSHLFGGPLETCNKIKARVKAVTGLTCSLGMAPTKLAAKIASDLKKPDGLVVVKAGELNAFLGPLDILKIWGLGPKTAQALRERGINTIGELALCQAQELSFLGKAGPELQALARGSDSREVKEEGGVKSVGNEITFETDTSDERVVKESLLALCDKVSSRLRAQGLKGRTITLKIRLEGFLTYTRAVTLAFATNFTDVINEHALKLFRAFSAEGGPAGLFGRKKGNKKIRLLGVKVSALMPADLKESLFEDKYDTRRENTHKAIEAIRKKFGRGAIYRAGGKKEI
ncbi:MAG: DNA polymerase IV [Elusimicrobia bacterium]|nr:DNA polymerase IV [Elusimicrobiota bacterium]